MATSFRDDASVGSQHSGSTVSGNGSPSALPSVVQRAARRAKRSETATVRRRTVLALRRRTARRDAFARPSRTIRPSRRGGPNGASAGSARIARRRTAGVNRRTTPAICVEPAHRTPICFNGETCYARHLFARARSCARARHHANQWLYRAARRDMPSATARDGSARTGRSALCFAFPRYLDGHGDVAILRV